ncbi:MAG: NADP-dependent isocitrate dehydrogenase [Deltaproteobacteria bacterium]|nr:NADP-dependent isocitrate dehydrogenase [Deltaproteobacteria bacterium]
MEKIKVKNPVVELDGDEMARVLWGWIRETLILPYLDIDLKYFDYHILNRDATENRIVTEAAEAIKKYRVGAKCAAINPDQTRVKEFGLKKAWKSPNSATRNQIGGTLFRQPIVFKNVPRLVPGWTKPIVVARHAFGDLYGGADFTMPRGGKVFLKYIPHDGINPVEVEICDIPGAGAALGIYNTEESVRGFALSCMNFGLERGYPVYLGTKNTELEHYDGLFKNIFQDVYDTQFRKRFEERGIGYEHRMVDELAAFAIRSSGGFVWACKNYDGDIQSDMVAAGFGSLGLMASMLLTPDGKTVLTEAAHGTVTRHFREHQAGRETSTNPVASIFAWSRAVYYRGLFDATPEVQAFATTLEKACIDTVEAGQMTKDLATLTGTSWLTTRQFLAKIKESLDQKLSTKG